MSMTVREAFQRGTDTFNAHDLDGFEAVLADDVEVEAPGGFRGEGKAACVAFFSGWLSAFPDARVEVHELHLTGDVAVEDGTFSGTQDGPLRTPAGDIPPTGRPVTVDYLQVIRFRDGKHVSFRLVFDRLRLLEQLGVVPAPAPARA
jgi:ketosteroid isomerase-like protein